MAEKDEREIKISHKKSDDFRYIPATGAYGGPNPQAEIICNFFVEYRKIPEESKVIIDTKTGKIKKELPRESESMIRELQVGIVMRPDIARSVGEWLIKEADKVTLQSPPKTKQH
jgi:hypothetical protein